MMAYAIDEFWIEGITKPAGTNFTAGLVGFAFDDRVGDDDVVHKVMVKVRVTIPEHATIAQLNEALLRKAVEQLRLALARSENRSAQELASLSVANLAAKGGPDPSANDP